MDTPVGERGESLSAGERQLVALARAYVADPDLLVLDEATSAVDPATEVRLTRALDALTGGRTTLTIAHRLSTAEAADEVLVVDAGRVVQRGPHAELVDADGPVRPAARVLAALVGRRAGAGRRPDRATGVLGSAPPCPSCLVGGRASRSCRPPRAGAAVPAAAAGAAGRAPAGRAVRRRLRRCSWPPRCSDLGWLLLGCREPALGLVPRRPACCSPSRPVVGVGAGPPGPGAAAGSSSPARPSGCRSPALLGAGARPRAALGGGGGAAGSAVPAAGRAAGAASCLALRRPVREWTAQRGRRRSPGGRRGRGARPR